MNIPATIHYANPSDVITDEHGSYAPVICGANGDYYSLDRNEVTCPTCLVVVTGSVAPPD